MAKTSHFSLTLFIFILHFSNTISLSPTPSPQSSPPAKPPAAAPPHHHSPHHPHTSSPPLPAPTDVIGILLKAGKFITFIRLIKATHVDYQLTSQINSSAAGITVFAPPDITFYGLKVDVGALNDKEKASLVQFHVLPEFLSKSDFQTISNPVKTLAGSDDKFTMTITTTENSVNISTGLTNASVASIVYSDKEVAIYEVDKVLLPKRLFPPAAAPAALSAMPAAESPDGLLKENGGRDSSTAGALNVNGVVVGVGIVIAAVLMKYL